MTGTIIDLGGVVFDDADVQWPLYRGSQLRTVVVQQGGDRAAEFEALPYINDLSWTVASEDGRADPAHDTITVSGVRLLEVRKLSEEVCELHLADCRADIARELFPADINILWRDGYLNGTEWPYLHEVIDYIVPLSPILAANIAPYLINSNERIEDGTLTAGSMMLAGLDRICESVGYDYTVGTDGLLYFATRATGSTINIATNAYNWAFGLEPTWNTTSRSRKGLPRVINVYYQQRHNIELEPEAAISVTDDELSVELVQRYGYNGEYLSLEDLLDALGGSITEEQIARVINTNNFDGTGAERDGSNPGAQLIAIIKRDWRKLYKVNYPSADGKRGGWSDLRFGELSLVNGELQNDIAATPVEAEFVTWFNMAEGNTLDGAKVGAVHEIDNGVLPDAPFSAAWESEPDDIIRLSFNGTIDNVQTAWLGRISELIGLQIYVGWGEDDDGNSTATKAGVFIPQMEDLKFHKEMLMKIKMVGTRRLPNNRDRWTKIEIPGFTGGDIDSVDLEVADELYSLHLKDFSAPQNSTKLLADAYRRATRYINKLEAALDGSATALGMELVKDLGKVDGAIREMTLRTDGLVVLSEISVGNLDNPQARYARKRRRDQQRKVRVSGKEIA